MMLLNPYRFVQNVDVGDPYWDQVVSLLHFDYDPYWENVVALLHFNGTDGSTDFVDEVGNTVSMVGSGPETTTEEYKFGGSSYHNSGSKSGLNLASSSDFTPTGDYTVETWIYIPENSSVTDIWYIVDTRVQGNDNETWNFTWSSNTKSIHAAQWDSTQHAILDIAGAKIITTNAWHHVALVRKDNTYTIFVDGEADVSGEVSGSFAPTASHPLQIGHGSSPGGNTDRSWKGYLQDLRITKGIARYTKDFTPPTRSFAYSPTNFRDEKGHVWIRNGDAIQETPKRFGNAALVLDGNGDFISSTNDDAFNFGLDDFTIECWMNAEIIAANQAMASRYDGTSTGARWEFRINTDGFLGFNYQESDAPGVSITGSSDVRGRYVHVVLQRINGTTQIFADGKKETEFTTQCNMTFTAPIGIGRWINAASGYRMYFKGAIDDFRITKGVARYTENFTPPTRAFPDSPIYDPYWENVVSLVHLNGAVGNTNTVDQTDLGWNTGYGNYVADHPLFTYKTCFYNPQSKGLHSYGNSNIVLGTNDCTIEFWYYNDSSDNQTVNWGRFLLYGHDLSDGCLAIGNYGVDNPRQLFVQYYNGGWGNITQNYIVIPNNQWNHIAVTRENGVWRVFLNGELKSEKDLSGNPGNNLTGTYYSVGASDNANNYHLYGYWQDVRITKGVARYTKNFTPPKFPFPNQ